MNRCRTLGCQAARRSARLLRELIVKLGLSALMVTHDQNEAMAISDRILLLNNGVIEQQGTPQEMYSTPSTLFTAEFMGSNNRLHGTVTDISNGRARIEGAKWSLWGVAGPGLSVGQQATAVIRVESLRLVDAPQDNSMELPMLTSMYLGDRWEYLFRTAGDDFVIRVYGTQQRDMQNYRVVLPDDQLWIFPQKLITATTPTGNPPQWSLSQSWRWPQYRISRSSVLICVGWHSDSSVSAIQATPAPAAARAAQRIQRACTAQITNHHCHHRRTDHHHKQVAIRSFYGTDGRRAMVAMQVGECTD